MKYMYYSGGRNGTLIVSENITCYNFFYFYFEIFKKIDKLHLIALKRKNCVTL